MPIDFPNSPSVNDIYTVSGRSWVYATTGIWNSVVTSATDLNSLSDVTITTATNAQFLKYSTGSSQWINTTLGTVNIDDLSDVVITSATTNQTLVYSTTGGWVNATPAAAGVTAGQAIIYAMVFG